MGAKVGSSTFAVADIVAMAKEVNVQDQGIVHCYKCGILQSPSLHSTLWVVLWTEWDRETLEAVQQCKSCAGRLRTERFQRRSGVGEGVEQQIRSADSGKQH